MGENTFMVSLASSCLNKVSKVPSEEISFETEMGWNLHGLHFAASTMVGAQTLLGSRDVVSCHDGEVWIVSYMARKPKLRIRRFSVDGRLLHFVDTTIPPASLGKHEYERVDPSSMREEGKKIYFERVILKSGLGKSQEMKREGFAIIL
ncbi:MAG: hypothetical protein WAO71_06165 [Gallionella sp.]